MTKPCTCDVIWNSTCPRHGLSKDDPRQAYLQEQRRAALTTAKTD